MVLYGVLLLFFCCVLRKFAEFDYVSSDLKPVMILGVSGSYPESSFPSSPAVKLLDSKLLFGADLITLAVSAFCGLAVLPGPSCPSSVFVLHTNTGTLCTWAMLGSPGRSEAAGWSRRL